MSRIGKKPVEVPKGVKVSINGRRVSVEGPKGTLSLEHHADVGVAWNEDEKAIAVSIDESRASDRRARAHWGTTRALIANMVRGVTEGYEQKMEVVGVGWTAAASGQNLDLKIGFANTIRMAIPKGLSVSVEKQLVTIKGADKQMVGAFAADMRAKRKPEPYNGKGIKYAGEVIKKKQGKQFGA